MSDAEDERHQLKLKLVRGFSANVPHNKALGMRILEITQGEALFMLPYDEKLVGNPDTGVLHGGAITALLDGASGAAVFAASQHGRDTWKFVLDSRIELYKVFWPTRQETGTTTLVVFGFVLIMGLFFWGVDALLAWITRSLLGTGTGG